MCAYIAENARWNKSVLSDDFAAILPFIALYFPSKFSLAPSVQYAMYTVCVHIRQNARWNTSVLTYDNAAILPCTALYLHPKCSHALYVEYTRVSSCFFNAILQCKPLYFTLGNCIQCALTFHRICVETQVFYPTMSKTLWTSFVDYVALCSIFKSF